MSKVFKKQTKIVIPSKLSNAKFNELQNVRIMQKNLVYVIGLSANIAKAEILSSKEYFGQYGKIIRSIVNNSKAYTGTNLPSYSAYITFASYQEAAIAILAIDYTIHDDLLIRASFGSTKYCTHFLKNIECPNKDCLYYHYFVDEKEIINNKEDNSVNTKRQTLAIELSDVYALETRNKLLDKKNIVKNAVFPTVNTIYTRDNVIENDHNKIISNHHLISEGNSSLKSILNKEKSPKEKSFKEDLNHLFSKKKLKDQKENNSTQNEINDLSTSNSRNTSSPNDEKIIFTLKPSLAELILDNNPTDNKCLLKRASMFSQKEKSRFKFADNSFDEIENKENVNIPDKINEIINKKTSTYYIMKNIDLSVDNYEDYIKKNCDNNEWIDFILNIQKEKSNITNEFNCINEY